MDDWHWADVSSTRPARSASASSTSARWHPAARGRSSGSSTTAGRSTSWAAVDGAGRPQAALVRAAARLRRPAADDPARADHRLALVLDNDTDEPWQARVRLQRKSFDGLERAVSVVTVDVPPRGTQTLPLAAALTWEVSRPRRGARRDRRRAPRALVLRRGPGPAPDERVGRRDRRADSGRLRRHGHRGARCSGTSPCSPTRWTLARSSTTGWSRCSPARM